MCVMRGECCDYLDTLLIIVLFCRHIAMEILANQPEGSFMVRTSSSSPGSYALSMKGPQAKILHYLIEPVPNGYRLQVGMQGGCGKCGCMHDILKYIDSMK